MLRLSLTLTAGDRSTVSITGTLRRLMMQALRQRACLNCQLSVDLWQNDILHYFEEWESEAAFRDQLLSERFRSLIALIEASPQPPILSVQLIGRSFGLEYFADVPRASRS